MAKEKLKKISFKKEPKLHLHKYIVAIVVRNKKKKGPKYSVGYRYAMNLKETKTIAHEAGGGKPCEVHVFKADHNFVVGYWK